MNTTRNESRTIDDANDRAQKWADYTQRRDEFYAGFPPCWREFLPAEWLPERPKKESVWNSIMNFVCRA